MNTDQSTHELAGTVWTEVEVSQNGLIATMYTMDSESQVTTLDSWHISPDEIETVVDDETHRVTSKHAILTE